MSPGPKFVPIPNSVPILFPKLPKLDELPSPDLELHFHVMVKPHHEQKDIDVGKIKHDLISVKDFMDKYKVKDEDLNIIAEYYKEHFNMEVDEVSPVGHMVHFSGKLKDIAEAFKIEFRFFDYNGFPLLGHTAEIKVPEELEDLIDHVTGLSEFPPLPRLSSDIAQVKKKKSEFRDDEWGDMTSARYAELYDFPQTHNGQKLDGKGQIYSLIAMGGDWETVKPDVEKYCKIIGVDVPVIKTFYQKGFKPVTTSSTDPKVIKEGLNRNNGELAMDLQIPIAITPKAEYHVYFVQQNFSGLRWGISTALYGSERYPIDEKGTPNVMAISWTFREEVVAPDQYAFFNRQILRSAAQVGMNIFCSSGDWGSSNNTSPAELCVNGPASSPYVVAVGGTYMEIQDDHSFTERIWSGVEEVLGRKWQVASGGGFSDVFNEDVEDNYDTYNTYIGNIYGEDNRFETFEGRVGLPDVSAISNSNRDGYFFVMNGVAKHYPGGTSAAAPMWATLFLQIGQALGRRISNIRPILYSDDFIDKYPLNNIVDHEDANNSIDEAALKDTWLTSIGWDPCTGLGTPDGKALLDYFSDLYSD